MHTLLLYVRILIKERYIRPRILALIRKIICAMRSYVRLVNQIFGILTRELYSGSYQILKYLHFGNLYLQLGYVTVSFSVYHKTYTSKFYTVLHYRISIICLCSHVVFSLCPVYIVFLHYSYLQYLNRY